MARVGKRQQDWQEIDADVKNPHQLLQVARLDRKRLVLGSIAVNGNAARS